MAINAKTALVALLLALTIAPTASFAAHRETERDIAPGSNEGPGTPGGLPNPGAADNDGQSPAQSLPSYGSDSAQPATTSAPADQDATAGSSDWQMPSSTDAVTGAHRRTAE
jgi:hypothetical protein